MKTLRVGIASFADMKARTLAIARGEHKPSPQEPKIWFASAESFARILSAKNRALLDVIAETEPESLTALAAKTGREKSNLSRTLKTMAQYGLVALKKSPRGKVIPRVPYSSIALVLPVGQTANP
jgi:predicted transcriptional regulator